ncbi:hypothetical protein QVD17_19655 [Tagetes erecta]|uniref:Uncharacterized protein n=1 Tax=Tagetes erecta TaxID=13708 RepID=A0AAD8KMP8_TARER|nr:hypothetical protein QVD17_19655 [Tagetes erecta]
MMDLENKNVRCVVKENFASGHPNVRSEYLNFRLKAPRFPSNLISPFIKFIHLVLIHFPQILLLQFSPKISLPHHDLSSTAPPGHHNHRSFPEAAPPSLVVGSSLTITARFHLHRFHHRSSATASKISTSAWLPPTTSPSIDD